MFRADGMIRKKHTYPIMVWISGINQQSRICKTMYNISEQCTHQSRNCIGLFDVQEFVDWNSLTRSSHIVDSS